MAIRSSKDRKDIKEKLTWPKPTRKVEGCRHRNYSVKDSRNEIMKCLDCGADFFLRNVKLDKGEWKW